MNGTPVVTPHLRRSSLAEKAPSGNAKNAGGRVPSGGLSSNPRAGPTLLATRIRVKAGAGHEKAPGYHTKGANFLSELFVTSRTPRARRRCVKGRDIRCAAGVGCIQLWGRASVLSACLAASLFASALVLADAPSSCRQSCRSPRRSERRFIPLVWARMNELATDTSDELPVGTASAFCEMDTPTTRLKMRMAYLVVNFQVTS